MQRSQHSRGRTFFEVLCIWALGGSFALAWLQTGTTAHLASAAIAALFGISWASRLSKPEPVEAAVEAATPLATDRDDETPPRIEIFAFEPEPLPEPAAPLEEQPAEAAKPKRRARKAKATKVETPAAVEEPLPQEAHLEPLFDPQPFVRQPRPAFGRRQRRPLPAA